MQLQEQWRRISFMRLRHWRHVRSRATANEGCQTGGSGKSSSSLPSYAVSEGHRRLQKEQNATTSFVPFLSRFVFRFASYRYVLFRFPLFSVSGGRLCDHKAIALWVSVRSTGDVAVSPL